MAIRYIRPKGDTWRRRRKERNGSLNKRGGEDVEMYIIPFVLEGYTLEQNYIWAKYNNNAAVAKRAFTKTHNNFHSVIVFLFRFLIFRLAD